MNTKDKKADAVHGRSAIETTEKGVMSNTQVDIAYLGVGINIDAIVEQLKLNGIAHYCHTLPFGDGHIEQAYFPTCATKEEYEKLGKAMGDVELFCNDFNVATKEYVLSFAKVVVETDSFFNVNDIENVDELLKVAEYSNGWVKAEQWFAENRFNQED